jgi:hypothetical protein
MQQTEQQNFTGKAIGRAVIATLLFSLLGLIWGSKMAAGVVSGGGLGVGGLFFSHRFFPWAFQTKRPKALFWLAWFVKMVVLFIFLGCLISGGLVNPIGFCIGVGIVPAVFTAQAIREMVRPA